MKSEIKIILRMQDVDLYADQVGSEREDYLNDIAEDICNLFVHKLNNYRERVNRPLIDGRASALRYLDDLIAECEL